MKISCMIITVGTALLMVGCASHPKTIDENEVVDKGMGILLASVTSDGNKQVIDAWYFYRNKGDKEESRLDAFGLGGIFGKPDDYPEQKAKEGRLLAVPLEPGEYELFNWMLYVSRGAGYGYLSPKAPPPSFPFTIAPGRITYLGNLHIDTIEGKNMFGISILVGGDPEISNSWLFDASLMKKKYPNFGDWPIQNSIPDGISWVPVVVN